jgi:phosphoglycerol transferase MdoB-like AlkP superfamily enzyme
MTYFIKTLYFIFGITLLSFAGLQFNDPDPIIWISFYALCALIPSLLFLNIFNRPLFILAITWCCVELFISAPGAYQYYLHMAEEPLMQGMNTQKPYIEECREFLGALIALALVVISAALAKKTL